MSSRWLRLGALALAVAVTAGCAAGRAFRRGESATRAGDHDLAVAHFRQAMQRDPNNPNVRIALERAMSEASRAHLDRARILEARDDLQGALREYTKANEFDPTNRQLAAKATEIERKIRARLEAARPKPSIDQLKQQVRQKTEPALVPTSRVPLRVRFPQANVKDVLTFIAAQSGINVTYDGGYKDPPAYSIDLDGVTLEQALQQVMLANSLFYKIINEKTILVANDSPQNRAKYEEMVVRTFYVSHTDVGELVSILNQMTQPAQGAGAAARPTIVANKSTGALTVRGTAGQVAVMERIVAMNDRPKAEITVDVEVLEVNRSHAKQYGLSLSDYALGIAFSPEQAPASGTGSTAGAVAPFNLNTVSQGINTADFYLSVPSAVVRLLETDSETKLIAKPQLRGQEGTKLTFNLGEEIPVPSTTYMPLITGGAATSPFTSFNYKSVGVNLEIEPKVTVEGDIILTLMVETSTLGRDINVAGQNLPSFGTRKVTTKLRLHDGESNLLAGLLREDERRSLRGFPGLIRLPFLRNLFSSNDNSISQTDVVMLLTPRIVRSAELTEADLMPIHIGTAQNPTIGGPPPLIWQPPVETPPVVEAAPVQVPPTVPAPTPVPGAKPTAAGVPALAGASPVPGTVMVPPKPVEAPPSTIVASPPVPPATPPVQAPPSTIVASPPAPPATPPVQAPPPTPPAQVTPPAAPPTPATPPAPAAARITVTLPGSEFRVGAGPYTIPLMIDGAARLSTLSLSLTFNPAVLRVRTVQEGSFMRQGGTTVAFVQQIDPAAGRIDLTLTRTTDVTGASGSGLLAALLVEPVAAGTTAVVPSGVGTVVGGGTSPLQLVPATVTVK